MTFVEYWLTYSVSVKKLGKCLNQFSTSMQDIALTSSYNLLLVDFFFFLMDVNVVNVFLKIEFYIVAVVVVTDGSYCIFKIKEIR